MERKVEEREENNKKGKENVAEAAFRAQQSFWKLELMSIMIGCCGKEEGVHSYWFPIAETL